MLRFESITVTGYEIDRLTIAWVVRPVDPLAFDPADIEYRVYRSNSPAGPFDLLTLTPLIDVYAFDDRSLNRRSLWRKFYYRVDALHVPSGNLQSSVVHRAEVPEVRAIQMLEALEIVRRERMLLRGIGGKPGYVGTGCLVFIRRTFGQRCAQCVNPVLGRCSLEKCTRCFNTRYVGGFFNPIVQYFNFNPAPEFLQVTNWGEAQPSETDGWTTNYPLLSAGDLIVEPTNRRWKVLRMHPTARLRVPVRQLCRFSEVNRSDIEQLVPVTDSMFDQPEFQDLMPFTTDFEARTA